MLVTILLVILVLAVLGALPRAGGPSWGYGPSGVLGVVLVLLLIFALMGRL